LVTACGGRTKADTLKRLEKAVWRMLNYNPVNEYIWFEVGKVFARQTNQWERKIAYSIEQSLAESTIPADEERFEQKIQILKLYYTTFRDCYLLIDDAKIQEYANKFSDSFIEAFLSTLRSGYQTTVLNRVIGNSTKLIDRELAFIESKQKNVDSTFSATRKMLKNLDTIGRNGNELFLQFYEREYHQKMTVFLENYLEDNRVHGLELSQKNWVYDMLNKGKSHLKRYQYCADSLNVLSGFIYENDNFFETYSFFYDITECILNTRFIYLEAYNNGKHLSVAETESYISKFIEAIKCTDFTKKKWLSKSSEIKGLIDTNVPFFKSITSSDNSELGYMYYWLAHTLWNENLTNRTLKTKNDIKNNLKLSEKYINDAIVDLKELVKIKYKVEENNKQIDFYENLKKEITKMYKDVD
jgi:hypothetical protein